jgi:hypothetical protein
MKNKNDRFSLLYPIRGTKAWVMDYYHQRKIAEFLVDPDTLETWWEGRWHISPFSAADAAILRQKLEDERASDFANYYG